MCALVLRAPLDSRKSDGTVLRKCEILSFLTQREHMRSERACNFRHVCVSIALSRTPCISRPDPPHFRFEKRLARVNDDFIRSVDSFAGSEMSDGKANMIFPKREHSYYVGKKIYLLGDSKIVKFEPKKKKTRNCEYSMFLPKSPKSLERSDAGEGAPFHPQVYQVRAGCFLNDFSMDSLSCMYSLRPEKKVRSLGPRTDDLG